MKRFQVPDIVSYTGAARGWRTTISVWVLSSLTMGLLVLPGCALLRRPTEPTLQTFQHYPLLPPASYGRALTAQHLMQGQARGQQFQLHTHIEIESTHIQVLGFTPWQTRAFVLRYDGTQLHFENFTNRKMPFPPALVLADIQQVLWPVLPNQGDWRVRDQGLPHERRVYFRDQLMTHIQYNKGLASQGDVVLSNLQFGYRLRIRTLTFKNGGTCRLRQLSEMTKNRLG